MTLTLLPVSQALARAVLDGDTLPVEAANGWPHADTSDALRPVAESGGEGTFLVVLDGRVIGDCGWFGPPGQDGEVEIGYGLAPAFRGKGHGTRAVAALLDWVESRDGVRAVTAEAEATNAASRRLLERLGFTVDGSEGARVRYVRRRTRGAGGEHTGQ